MTSTGSAVKLGLLKVEGMVKKSSGPAKVLEEMFALIRLSSAELRDARRDLNESKDRYRSMIETVKDYGIFQLDAEGIVMSWNTGARNISGYEADEIIGKHFSTFYPPEDVVAGKPEWELAQVRKHGRVEDEGWRVRKDGSRFWANVVVSQVADRDGKVIGFTKVTRDLTERREMERELRLTNEKLEAAVAARTRELERALAVRDEFLSIASHELKTPLTALKLQIEINKRRIQKSRGQEISPDKLLNSYDMELRQINTITELVESLLDVSRIQTGQLPLAFAEMNLSELVNEMTERFLMQSREAGCTLTAEVEEGVTGRWDRYRLQQVITNLVSNAIKYAPKSAIKISLSKNTDHVLLKVADEGPGIPREMHDRIFERFERANVSRSVGGLGLGLFITRNIIEAHGGEIALDSSAGKGTTFIIRLP